MVRQSVYGFSLPNELSNWLSVFQLFSFDVGGFLFPSWTCIGSLATRLVCSGLWPFVVMVAVALVLSARAALSKGSLQRVAMSSLEAAIFISFCLLPSVTNQLFLAFQCENFRHDDSTSPPESRLYLSASLNVECYNSAEHELIYNVASVFIVLWPVAMPLLYALLLFRCRLAILNHEHTDLSRAIHFLWDNYDDTFFWWELVELGRRLLLTNLVQFFNLGGGGSNKLLRLFVGLVIAVVALALQLIAQPFRSPMDDALSAVVQLALVIFFVAGIVIKLCDVESANAVHSLLDAQLEPSQVCSELVGIESGYTASIFIILTGIMVMLVPLCLLLYAAAQAARAARRNAVAEGAAAAARGRMSSPPTCNWQLKEGNSYLTFLSHYKVEAGSDARYLSDLIQRMTGCHAYLDSTDLIDLRTLFNEGVHKTDVLFVLATKGVFTRTWCLMEMWEAALQQIPIVIFPVVGGDWSLADSVKLLSDLMGQMESRNKECMREVMGHVKQQGVTDVREVEDVLLAHLGLVPTLERPGRHASVDLDGRLCARLQIDVADLEVWLTAQHDRVERQLRILSWQAWGTDNQIIASVQMLLNEGAAVMGRGVPAWKENFKPGGETSAGNERSSSLRRLLSEKMFHNRQGKEPSTDHGHLLIVCAREESGGHLRLMQQEFGKGLRCEVIIGTEQVDMWLSEVEQATRGVILLQTRRVLQDPVRLLQLFEATRRKHPLVCINVVGGGYDFAKVKPLLNALSTELSQVAMATLRAELQGCGYGVGQLSSSLIQAVPNAISVFFNTAAGGAMVDAAIEDTILKLGRKAELLKLHAIGTQSKIGVQAESAKALWQGGAAMVKLGVGLNWPGGPSTDGGQAEPSDAVAPQPRSRKGSKQKMVMGTYAEMVEMVKPVVMDDDEESMAKAPGEPLSVLADALVDRLE